MLEQSELKKWLKQRLSELLKIDITKIDENEKFSTYGVKSSHATLLAGEISEKYKEKVSPTAFYAYPNITSVCAKISGEKDKIPSFQLSAPSTNYEPIAIIGMSCRFPQANTPSEFWDLLVQGKNAVTEIPTDRWDVNQYYDPDPMAEGKTNTKHGAFIDGIDDFDPFFFNISPREAQEMSQSQRLILEIVWEALANAKISAQKVAGTNTGVFIGNAWNDFERTRLRKHAPITQHSAVGQSASIIANRVSYAYGFRGPSIVVDSACSSALLAVHLACNSIQEGDSNLAIAGGINIMIEPDDFVAMSKFGGLSPTGKCHTFDESADGYVRGEGLGVVVLKKLSEAQKDKDKIYGIVRGSAVNNDGYSNGLTAPNMEAQKEVLTRTYQRAGWNPTQIQYVETHGTGTKLGDPIETEALGAIYGNGRAENQELIIGSVKTNIGHLEGAAGIAGLIKVLLSMQHRVIPKNLHFENPNPLIAFDDLNLKVPAQNTEWSPHEKDITLKAGVSSFGWGGTNAHLVVEEYIDSNQEIFALSGDTDKEVFDLLRHIKDVITEDINLDLKELCAEFSTLHSHKRRRLSFKVASIKELDERISEIILSEKSEKYTILPKNYVPKLVFVCSPYGGQHLGMCKKMYEESRIFRRTLQACDEVFQPLSSWSLVHKLLNLTNEDIENTEIIVPVVFSTQVALIEQYKQWGIVPDAVVGHSIGEIAAAYVAGFLTLEDATTVVYHYSKIINTSPGKETLAFINHPADLIKDYIDEYDTIEIAAYNTPDSVNVGGDKDEINKLIKKLHNNGIVGVNIPIHIAPHTQYMEEYVQPITEALKDIKSLKGNILLYSTSLNKVVEQTDMKPQYWANSIRKPVQFQQSMKFFLEDYKADILLEISPEPVLKREIRKNIQKARPRPKSIILHTLDKTSDDWLNCQNILHLLYLKGIDIDWKYFYSRYVNPRFHNPDDQPAEELVLPISAKTEYSLQKYVERYVEFLNNTDDSLKSIYDICASAAIRKSHFDYRVAFYGKNKDEILKHIADFQEKNNWKNTYAGKLKGGKKVAFVFPGYGAQWKGMGKDLFEKEKVFENVIRECDRAFANYVDWSLVDFMQNDSSKAEERFDEPEVTQPFIFAVQIALAQLWKSWGITPSSVIGHSLGEIAAAYISGILSLDDAVKVICYRSQLMARHVDKGGMVIAEISIKEAEELAQKHTGKLSIAVNNSPKSTALSGDIDAVEAVLEELKAQDCRRVKINVASHSFQMDDITPQLIDKLKLEGVVPKISSTPMYSTVRAKRLADGEADAGYWGDNLRNTVRFANTVDVMIREEHTLFIEVSPHPVLSSSLRECLAEAGINEDSAIVASTFRGTPDTDDMIHNMADMYCHGANIDWDSLYNSARNFVELPSYPWHREHYEIEDNTDEFEEHALHRNDGTNRNPLLPYHIPLAGEEHVNIWETRLNLPNFQFLQNYQTYQKHSLPVSAYMEMLESAIEQVYGHGNYAANDIHFRGDVLIEEKTRTIIQLKIVTQTNGGSYFKFYHTTLEPKSEARNWKLLAEGSIAETIQLPDFDKQLDMVKFIESFYQGESKTDFYKYLQKFGYEYGTDYRCVQNIWRTPNGIVGQIIPTETIRTSQEKYKLHPMLMDACFKILLKLLPPKMQQEAESYEYYIDSLAELHLADLDLYHSPFWVEAQLDTQFDLIGNFTLYDRHGKVIAKAKNIVFAPKRTESFLNDWLYHTKWNEIKSLSNKRVLSGKKTTTVVFADNQEISTALIEKLRFLNLPYVVISTGYNFKVQKNKRNGTWQQDFHINPSQFADYEELMWYLTENHKDKNFHFVYAWTLDGKMPTSFALNGDYIESQQETVTIGLVHLQQMCATMEIPPSVTVLTSGVCKVKEVDTRINIVQSPVWGMSRVITNEFPEQNFRNIDLSFVPSMNEMDVLLRDLFTFSDETQIAIRGSKQYTVFLEKNNPKPIENLPSVALKAKGMYLVTGFRGLGIAFIEWMFDKGARNFVLLSRSGKMSENTLKKVKQLEEKGAKFWVETADVSNIDELEEIVNKVEEIYPIRGVVHAAGVVKNELLINLDKRSFNKMTQAKIKGTWNLHHLTQNRSLDLFVMFSSISVLSGSRGLSYYVAGNYFLDAFAHYRNLQGLPATTINWGLIKDVGMGADNDNMSKYAQAEGIIPFEMHKGMEVFEEVLRRNITQTGIFRLNPKQFTLFYDSPSSQIYLKKLRVLSSEETGETEYDLFQAKLYKTTAENERQKLLERFLKGQISNIAKMTLSDISITAEFKQLGIDSLMAIQLRNAVIEGAGVKVSVTTFWAHPTLRQYVKYLLSQLKTLDTVEKPKENIVQKTVKKPKIEVEKLDENLSLDDVSSILDDELSEFEF